MKLYKGFQDENEARKTRRIQRRFREKQLREKAKQTKRNIAVVDEGNVELSRQVTRRGPFKRSHNHVHPAIVQRQLTRLPHNRK